MIDNLTQRIKTEVNIENFVERAEKGGGICPHCGSGRSSYRQTGGLVTYADNRYYCFACGNRGDVVDLYMQTYHVDFQTAKNELVKYLENDTPVKQPLPKIQNKSAARRTEIASESIDYVDYYRACCTNLKSSTEALHYVTVKRGISFATARKYWLGFDPVSDPTRSGHPAPRIIIPVSRSYYIGRVIDNSTPKVLNVKNSTPTVFNVKSLQEQDFCFVTEGAFDALSIIDVEFSAIALNSISKIPRFLEHLEENPPKAKLLLALDNDGPGQKATQELAAGLDKLNIKYRIVNISEDCKDPNEALIADRSKFENDVSAAISCFR